MTTLPRAVSVATPTLVLLSGGLDSAACLAFLRNVDSDCSGLFVDYGHSAAMQEHRAAVEVAKFYQVPLNRIVISGLPQWGAGFVPGRNAFLLHAALMAAKFKTGVVAIGIHAGTNYVDCSESFLRQMQSSFDVYGGGRIGVIAPFLSWTKAEILEYCRTNAVPVEITYSCEVGQETPCGQCLSCLDRGSSFEAR